MKTYLLLGLTLLISGVRTSFAQKMEMSRLELTKKHVFYIRGGDSSVTLKIDTLIMHAGARIVAMGKKNVIIISGYVETDKKCSISGDDGRNNGTNFDLRMNFVSLNMLIINAVGKNTVGGNRSYPMGHGGNVTIHYLATGLKPQISQRTAENYVIVNTDGGKGSISPNTDLAIIQSQINSGSTPGRPLSGLRNGTIFQGSDGNNGKIKLQSVEHL